MNSSKVAMCSCTEVGLNIVDYLFDSGIRINHFVSLSQDQATHYEVSGYASFEDVSKGYGIPIYYPKSYSLKNDEDISFFSEKSFSLLIVAGWQRLIPGNILKTLAVGGIGVHGSSEFLPKGRGRSPINWSLIEGKQRFILHLILFTANADDGDIIAYEMFDINPWDNCRTLYYKNSILTKRMLEEHIPKLLSNNFSRTQQYGEPSYYLKRKPKDGLIDWNETVFDIYNFIRALTTPYPGAYTFLNDKKVVIWKAQPFDTRISYYGAKAGEIVDIFSTGDFIVNCNSGLLLVTECDTDVTKGQLFKNNTNKE